MGRFAPREFLDGIDRYLRPETLERREELLRSQPDQPGAVRVLPEPADGATTYIQNLGSHNAGGFNVQLANNPGGGRGGTCFGDSGGPTLLDDTDVIVGVTFWGFGFNRQTCGGVGSPTGPTSRP